MHLIHAGYGETITVTVNVKGTGEGVQGLQATLDYDKDTLEYVSNKALASGWIVTGYNKDTGVFLVELADVTDTNSYIKSSTKLVEFTFKVKENTTENSTLVKISNIVASGASNLKSNEVSKNVTITGQKIKANITNSEAETATTKKTTSKSNTKSSSTLNNKAVNTEKSSTSGIEMPNTGIKHIYIVLLIIAVISIYLYKKCQKYKDI